MDISQSTSLNTANYPSSKGNCPKHQAETAAAPVQNYQYNKVSVSYQLSLSTPNETVKYTYSREQVSSNYQSAVSASESSETTESAEVKSVESAQPERLAGAQRILDFITSRIDSEKAQGATTEELTSLVKDGLSGFVQGFDEAKEILTGSGTLSSDVTGEINLLYNQVMGGISELAQSLELDVDVPELLEIPVAEEAANTTPATTSVMSSNADISSPVAALKTLKSDVASQLQTLTDTLDAVDAVQEAQMSYGRKDSFKFSLTTQDGDKIQINASAMTAYYAKYGADDSGESFIEGLKEKGHFSMQVKGDLDEGEQAAIYELLDQVFSLADEFYNGDLDKAYQAALDLGYDETEIARYSLKLNQTVQAELSSFYPEALPSEGVDRDILGSLGDFTQRVVAGLTNPDNYQVFDFSELLNAVAEQIDNQVEETEYRFSDAIGGITDVVDPLGEHKAA